MIVTGPTTLQKIQKFSDIRKFGGETVLFTEKNGLLKIAFNRR
jgi:hypothetical protein